MRSSDATYLDAAQRALLLALVRRQLGGVVRVGMPTAAELGGLLLPLLDLLHVPAAALVVLQQRATNGLTRAQRRGGEHVARAARRTFIWIFFCSSSMASCWAALRAARRSSRSLGEERSVEEWRRWTRVVPFVKCYRSCRYLARSRAASSLAFSFSCRCCSMRASCSFLFISSSSTRAWRSASRRRFLSCNGRKTHSRRFKKVYDVKLS